METDLKEFLTVSKDYERYSFLRGVASLYFNLAIVINLGMFGLLVLEAFADNEIFYDKGVAKFTIIQVGQVIVLVGVLGNLIYRASIFLTDQQHFTYLENPERKRKLQKIAFVPIFLGIILAGALIILAVLSAIREHVAWMLPLVFVAIYLIFIWRVTSHWPTLVVGGMVLVLSLLVVFSPEPVWAAPMMTLCAAGYIGAILSHFYAQGVLE